MTRIQKIILIVLAVLDVLVIGVMAIFIVSSISNLPQVTPLPTQVARVTETLPPTWTPTPAATATPTLPPFPTRTPRATRTPFPTSTPRPTATPGPIEIQNADFDMIMPNRISGWEWDAYVNYRPGDTYDPQASYAEPMFMPADDPARWINGSTLKIETIRWLKFRAWIYQPVTVTTGSTAYFRVKANAYSSIDTLVMGAGINPYGDDCERARWSEVDINQEDGVVTITSPRVTVGEQGFVTVCLFAEPNYPDVNNAAFFDQAELIVSPPP